MDLSLIKRWADDGVAKHKAFVDLQAAVDDAQKIEQFANELRDGIDALKVDIDAKVAERDRLTQSVSDLKGRVDIQMAQLKAELMEAEIKAEAQRKSISDSIVEKQRFVQSQMASHKAQLDSTHAQHVEAMAALEKERADKIAQIKSEVLRWENALASAKSAYDNFIASLNK